VYGVVMRVQPLTLLNGHLCTIGRFKIQSTDITLFTYVR
jgi:hypothetical protein